jgi:hypothetical protein
MIFPGYTTSIYGLLYPTMKFEIIKYVALPREKHKNIKYICNKVLYVQCLSFN